MCLDERNTDSLARPAAPSLTARRTVALRRSVRSFTVAMVRSCSPLRVPSLLLAFLAEDELARVFHALALVGLRRPEAADFRGLLADQLLVSTGDGDLGRLRRRDRDALRDWIHHVVAQPDLELEVLALQRGAIADAVDLELLLVTLGDADDQIVDQRAR